MKCDKCGKTVEKTFPIGLVSLCVDCYLLEFRRGEQIYPRPSPYQPYPYNPPTRPHWYICG
jgi:hypothetical protein